MIAREEECSLAHIVIGNGENGIMAGRRWQVNNKIECNSLEGFGQRLCCDWKKGDPGFVGECLGFLTPYASLHVFCHKVNHLRPPIVSCH